MTDNFLDQLADEVNQSKFSSLKARAQTLSDEAEVSTEFDRSIYKLADGGKKFIQNVQRQGLNNELSDYTNRLRDEIAYGDIDYTNSATLLASKKRIEDVMNEFRSRYMFANDERAAAPIDQAQSSLLSMLSKASAVQFHKRRIDQALDTLSYDQNRHTDYENVLDTPEGASAYHTLMANMSTQAVHSYISTQRQKALNALLYNSNLSDDTVRIAAQRAGLSTMQADAMVQKRDSLRLQMAVVHTLDTDRLQRQNPDAALIGTEFNSIFDLRPDLGTDTAASIIEERIKNDQTLDPNEKAIRIRLLQSYKDLTQQTLSDNPLEYLIQRNLLSPAGFATKYPADKTAARLEAVLQTMRYTNSTSPTIFTKEDQQRMKVGDVSIVPFLQGFDRQLRNYNGYGADVLKRRFDDAINNAAPIITTTFAGLNTAAELTHMTDARLQNPGLDPGSILDSYVAARVNDPSLPEKGSSTFAEYNTIYAEARRAYTLYQSDPLLRKVLQNEYAKMFGQTELRASFDLPSFMNSAGVRILDGNYAASPGLWTTKSDLTDRQIRDDLYQKAIASPSQGDSPNFEVYLSKAQAEKAQGRISKAYFKTLLAVDTYPKVVGINRYQLYYILSGKPVLNQITGQPVEVRY
ncbi:MAG: hypothetical protein ACRCX2_10530 [Paraclostridium sp.]